LSITPRRGLTPAVLTVSLNAGVPSGKQFAHVRIGSSATRGATREVLITAVGSAPVLSKPAVEPKTPVPNSVTVPPSLSIPAHNSCIATDDQPTTPPLWTGRLKAKLEWNGFLEPHGCLIVSPSNPSKFFGPMFPSNVKLSVSVEPSGVQRSVGKGKVFLLNNTSSVISHITVNWEVEREAAK
jgi:hypothetical protein